MKMKGMQGMDMGDDMSGMDMRKMPGMKMSFSSVTITARTRTSSEPP